MRPNASHTLPYARTQPHMRALPHARTVSAAAAGWNVATGFVALVTAVLSVVTLSAHNRRRGEGE